MPDLVEPNEGTTIHPGEGRRVSSPPVPHQGRAPSPQRTETFEPPHDEVNMGDASHGTTDIQEIPTNSTPTEMMETPPPAQPEQAAQELSDEKRIGELIQAVGSLTEKLETQEADHLRQMEEMRLEAEIGRVPAAPPQGQRQQAAPIIPMPPDVDPEATLTVQQASQMFANGLAAVAPEIRAVAQADAIRASWDVTLAEETDILARNPALNQHREPDRTRLIQRAVNLRRGSTGQATANGQTPASEATNPTQPQQTRTPQAPLPHVESRQPAPMGGEPRPSNRLAEAQAEYARLQGVKDSTVVQRNQRLAQMQKLFEEINALQGVTQDMQKNSFVRQT